MKIILRLYMAILVIVFVISCGDQTTDQQQNEAKTQTTYRMSFTKQRVFPGHPSIMMARQSSSAMMRRVFSMLTDNHWTDPPRHILPIQQWTAHLPLAGFPMMTGYCIMQTKAVMS
jgi:PBP1b-binding outer membrane lipoprotein LpoB